MTGHASLRGGGRLRAPQSRLQRLFALGVVGPLTVVLGGCEPPVPTKVTPSATSSTVSPAISSTASGSSSNGASPIVPPSTPSVRADAFGAEITVSLACDRPIVMVGEPLYLSFTAAMRGTQSLSILDGGDYRNQLGRSESYKVSATDGAGKPLPVRDAGPGFGGLTGPRPLTSAKPFVKRLLATHWVQFLTPGRYTITVEKTLEIGEGMDFGKPGSRLERKVVISTPIEVIAGSPEQLGVVIDNLGKTMLAESDDTSAEAERALAEVRDPRVVPYFVKAIDAKGASMRMYGVWGLRPFATDDALAGLEHALSVDGLRLAAAQTLSENTHPRAWDVLWALRSDREMNVRLTVLHALAKKSPPDVVAQLKNFEQDADPLIKQEATRYLREHAAKPNKRP